MRSVGRCRWLYGHVWVLRTLVRRDQMTAEPAAESQHNDRPGSPAAPYCCSFCRIELKPTPCRGIEYVKRAVLLQTFVCPHCFDHYTRPIAAIGRLPFVGWLVAKLRTFRECSATEELPIRGRVTWIDRFVEFGQAMMSIEGRCIDAIRAGIRRIMTSIFNRS